MFGTTGSMVVVILIWLCRASRCNSGKAPNDSSSLLLVDGDEARPGRVVL